MKCSAPISGTDLAIDMQHGKSQFFIDSRARLASPYGREACSCSSSDLGLLTFDS